MKVNDCLIFVIGAKNAAGLLKALPETCELHVFDHLSEAPDFAGSQFHELGLSGPITSNPLLKSLPALAANVSNSWRRIDLLRIDCDGCELEALSNKETTDFLASTVSQLLIKVHFPRITQKLVRLAEALRTAGFLTFSKEPDLLGRVGGVVEFSLYNVKMARDRR